MEEPFDRFDGEDPSNRSASCLAVVSSATALCDEGENRGVEQCPRNAGSGIPEGREIAGECGRYRHPVSLVPVIGLSARRGRERGDDVGGVTVLFVAHRGARIGVASGLLHVAQWHPDPRPR